MKEAIKKENLIWLDAEFTGLDFKKDKIVEIAIIITDKKLKILAKKSLVVNLPEKDLKKMQKTLKKMSPEVAEKFEKSFSNLEIKSRKSKYDTKKSEKIFLNFLKKYCLENSSPLCGNSVCSDRRMLAKDMPELEKFFHYRNLDVSSLKILAQKWQEKKVFNKKKENHRALDDVLESIEELKYYRKNLLKS